MARSFRSQPIIGRTCAESDKRDKQLAHRRNRVSANALLRAAIKGDADAPIFSREHPLSGCAFFAKDGKVWFGKSFPKAMRK